MSLNSIKSAIEKIAENETAKTVGAAGVGAAVGAGGATAYRHLAIHKEVGDLASRLNKAGMGVDAATVKGFKDIAHEGLRKAGIKDIVNAKIPVSHRLKMLAMKKRVMAPVGASLAAGAYLLKKKDK